MANSNKAKKIIIALLALAALVAAFYVYNYSSNNESEAAPVKVAIVSKGESFETVVKGFESGLKAYAEAAGRPVQIIRADILGTEPSDYNLAVEKVIAEGAEAIFAVALEPMKASSLLTKENQIPVVYAFGGDPTETGFIESLNSSGNNLTGVTWLAWVQSGKRLEVLSEIVPSIKRVTTITKAQSKSADISFRSITDSAEKLNLEITQKVVKTDDEIEGYLKGTNSTNADAIYYVPDPFILRNANTLIRMSIEQKLPIIFHESKFADDGALASYGPKFFDAGKQASGLMSKIVFDGLAPTNIPSEEAKDFEFVINLKTAALLGITVPPEVISKADRVIR